MTPRIVRTTSSLVLLFVCLLTGCGVGPESLHLSAVSKDARILSQDRVGFRLHDEHEDWGFVRVALRSHVQDDANVETFTLHLRVRNESVASAYVNLDDVWMELFDDGEFERSFARRPLESEAQLRIPPGENVTARVRWDLTGLEVMRRDEMIQVHVPYRVGFDRFEVRVPFVKTANPGPQVAIGRVVGDALLLTGAFALDALIIAVEVAAAALDDEGEGISDDDEPWEFVFPAVLEDVLHRPTDAPTPTIAATRLRVRD